VLCFHDRSSQEEVDLLELKRKVCEVLLPEETVQQALQRLGKTIKLARAAQVITPTRHHASSTL
jgi:L-fucose isomerase-like protein